MGVAMVLLLPVVGEVMLQVASAAMSETASEDTSSKCRLPIRRTISFSDQQEELGSLLE
jgi:hypothetical protein